MNDSGDVNLVNHRQHQLHYYLIHTNLHLSTRWSAKPSKLTISICMCNWYINYSISREGTFHFNQSINQSIKGANSQNRFLWLDSLVWLWFGSKSHFMSDWKTDLKVPDLDAAQKHGSLQFLSSFRFCSILLLILFSKQFQLSEFSIWIQLSWQVQLNQFGKRGGGWGTGDLQCVGANVKWHHPGPAY